MKIFFFRFSVFLVIVFFYSCQRYDEARIHTRGLQQPVEVIRDRWGVNHIYAKNRHDLFFAQGYLAARDRLFQFEIWRRQATGTVAEILGPREIRRDIGARLFRYRGDMEKELSHYHPQGKEIVEAYVEGVNRYIEEALKDPEHLPLEFRLLHIKPAFWTPEIVISRHQGLLGNITLELATGRAVSRIGPEKVNALAWFHPKKPDLTLDSSITKEMLDEDILGLYMAFRKKIRFLPEDIDPLFRNPGAAVSMLNQVSQAMDEEDQMIASGSNNWVVSGSHTDNGYTFMANDPHRTISVPSLRYMVHLVAPGWNVTGGGEPEIPGVSIGHNEYGAWGLTVFFTDGEDLLMYKLNPDNPDQYLYKGQWKTMKIIRDTIRVKDTADVPVVLRYTIHGPVTYIDTIRHVAWAVRCAWLEPGGSPYLASLRMDQARNWEEFRDACTYSNIPGENMVWAGKDGTIGWQAVGIAPVRRNYSGLVPVPGDGRYEWDGYLPIREKPHMSNPEKGFIVTANQNITPRNYSHWDAIGYTWRAPYRGNRLSELLEKEKKIDMDYMKTMQTDYYSIPARILIPYLNNITFSSEKALRAQKMLKDWNFILDKNSVAAGIYNEWENQIMENAAKTFIPAEARGLISLQLPRVLQWIKHPETMFGPPAEKRRDLLLQQALLQALATLTKRMGPDMSNWQYGQPAYKHITIRHAFSGLVNDTLTNKFDTDTLPRGGNAYCPNVTGSLPNQTRGASFRILVNTGDWDGALAINTPGQSGDPDSPFYKNLFHLWGRDEYFPLYFSKEKIISVAAEHITLAPQ